MKEPPDIERLTNVLNSRKISGYGFLGDDPRSPIEIIEDDATTLVELGKTRKEVAARMQEITQAAKAGLETTVKIDDVIEAQIMEARGFIPCPWPHPGIYGKAVTTVKRTDTGNTVRWADLNIHMIEAHGFFEGRGSAFRIEPKQLVEIIFIDF